MYFPNTTSFSPIWKWRTFLTDAGPAAMNRGIPPGTAPNADNGTVLPIRFMVNLVDGKFNVIGADSNAWADAESDPKVRQGEFADLIQ